VTDHLAKARVTCLSEKSWEIVCSAWIAAQARGFGSRWRVILPKREFA